MFFFYFTIVDYLIRAHVLTIIEYLIKAHVNQVSKVFNSSYVFQNLP